MNNAEESLPWPEWWTRLCRVQGATPDAAGGTARAPVKPYERGADRFGLAELERRVLDWRQPAENVRQDGMDRHEPGRGINEAPQPSYGVQAPAYGAVGQALPAGGHRGGTTIRDVIEHGWGDVYTPILAQAGEALVQFETRSDPVDGEGPFIVASARLGDEDLSLYSSQQLLVTVLRGIDEQIDGLPAEGPSLALVVEYAFADFRRLAETLTGQRLAVTDAHFAKALPQHPWLHLAAYPGDGLSGCGLAGGPALLSHLKAFASRFANRYERTLDPTLTIKIGPVMLPVGDLADAKPGTGIDCGIDPAGDVRGMVERADGYYWPCTVENNGVLLTGPLSPPPGGADAEGFAAAGIAIGEINLAPVRRAWLEAGHRLPMARFPNDGAFIRIGQQAPVPARLAAFDGSLGVRITGAGA
ncbi:hypothetical protein CSC94_14505 [Zhengella mangrovi]|uniref:Uncharacterized protein n=1 Tax=Zhengella mangrovi TaxID=1982044 RepID=A0A2G1QLT6_9HYPH|nr:hypothetical protein [Zhengella mangrovi]PHP66486.1 hypothetical protein CSC94_14505 [Zhengella mangrovi]